MASVVLERRTPIPFVSQVVATVSRTATSIVKVERSIPRAKLMINFLLILVLFVFASACQADAIVNPESVEVSTPKNVEVVPSTIISALDAKLVGDVLEWRLTSLGGSVDHTINHNNRFISSQDHLRVWKEGDSILVVQFEKNLFSCGVAKLNISEGERLRLAVDVNYNEACP